MAPILLLACGLAFPAAAQRAVVVGPEDQVVIAPRGGEQPARPGAAAPSPGRARQAPDGPVPMAGRSVGEWANRLVAIAPAVAAVALGVLLPGGSGGGTPAGAGLGAGATTVAR
ncbi:hypothetical protein [Siccirubricoccus phaeus]|uniref:hypothetical protein n=1 Tax=Siccirubricoccus phaeus TaxID=2595053 RepID=UPI0011F2F764|nr:hypothetical protein [Siccirubricoccus phaeus]